MGIKTVSVSKNYIDEDTIEEQTHLLLKEHTYYCQDNYVYGDYNKHNKFKTGDPKIFKSHYICLDQRKSNLLIRWIKYIPYGHTMNILYLIEYGFNNYSCHLKKSLKSELFFSKIKRPIDRMLWFIYEEWIADIIGGSESQESFNTNMYFVSKFVVENKLLFI